MKKKSSSDHIFGRTLFWVLLLWLGMVILAMIYNFEQQKSLLQLRYSTSNSQLRTNLALCQNYDWDTEEEERLGLTHILSNYSYFTNSAMRILRLYDRETGEELARSQLAFGVVYDQNEEVTHYLLLDDVLNREEHLTLAENLRQDPWNGAIYREDEEWNEGADYAELTGFASGKVFYPQKVVYYYDDQPKTMIDSTNPMFEGKELTTLKADRMELGSDLSWSRDYLVSLEMCMELYEKATSRLEEQIERRKPTHGGTLVSEQYQDTRIEISSGAELNDYLASSYTFIPWRVAYEGLGIAYIFSFVDAVIVAAIIAHMERKHLRKERELTRAMAHELKTPAAVMRAYAEALKEDVAPERREEYLDTIVEESDRLGGMVSELLDLSRMSGAKTAMEFVRVDLKPIVEGCFERLRLPLEERGLEVRMDLERAVVNGDPKRLEHMVSNLALNVLHHAQPGPVRVKLNAKGELVVENRCAPMDKETLKRIWEPFYKVNGDGNGLGLAIVHNIVTQHQGGCYTQITEDGIRFIIRL